MEGNPEITTDSLSEQQCPVGINDGRQGESETNCAVIRGNIIDKRDISGTSGLICGSQHKECSYCAASLDHVIIKIPKRHAFHGSMLLIYTLFQTDTLQPQALFGKGFLSMQTSLRRFIFSFYVSRASWTGILQCDMRLLSLHMFFVAFECIEDRRQAFPKMKTFGSGWNDNILGMRSASCTIV
ncbi:hypothetical protein CEXT_216171 [Caerostris extrusa]|uniref:Uncharacterized protein n=1 Tax=Caerostris extrusa TaxID=172846 RepID=A0AAV4XVF0_CAEEX|nr:hypothetical protein CEXT_216171 [Caerostris extrusa]